MTEANTSQTNEQQAKEKNSKIITKMVSMAVNMDLVTDPIEAVEKWRGALDPDKDTLIKDFADVAAGIETERTELAKKLASYTKDIYTNNLFQYKEAMQLLEGLQLKNKGIAQIIGPYYFVRNDLEPLDRTPLSEAEKKVIAALAEKIDNVFSDVIDDLKGRSDRGIWPPEDYTAEDLYFSYITIFANEYLPKQGPEPHIIWAKGEASETITGTITGEVQPRQLELPFLPPITPKYYVMPNNALANDLENRKRPRINYGAYDLSVFGEKSDITSYIAISYEPDPDSGIQIKGPDRLTAYERAVSNAVISLWEAAQKEGTEKPVITPEMIYRTMPGGGEKLSGGQKSAIVKAIRKFQILHIEINATEEMQKRKVIGPKESFTLDSNYLLTTHAQYRAQNGRTVHAYRIEAEPIILTYSKAAKQLLSIPAKYLDIRQVKNGKPTDKPLRMNEDRQAITDYLLRRIAIMKRDAKNKTQHQSPDIVFDTLFSVIGKENEDRDTKKEYRNFCFEVLDYQTAAGNIKGYKKIKEGTKIAKIEILI